MQSKIKLLAGLVVACAFGVAATIVAFVLLDTNNTDANYGAQQTTSSFDEISLDEVEQNPTQLLTTNLPSDFDYFSTLYKVLETVSNSQLQTLLLDTQQYTDLTRRDGTQVAIVRKMSAHNPVKTLQNLKKLSKIDELRLTKTVFAAWSRTNLNQAIKHASSMPLDLRKSALQGIMSVQTDLNNEKLHELTAELDHGDGLVDSITDQILDVTVDNPELTWLEIIADGKSEAFQVSELLTVGRAWLNQSGFSVLEQISDSLTTWEVRYTVINGLLFHLAEEDLKEAFDYAINLTENYDHTFLTAIVESWAQKDPESAMQSIASLESEEIRRNMYHNFVQAWARSDPNALLAQLDQLPENMKVMGQESALQKLAETDPKGVLSYLPSIENTGSRNNILYSIADNWARIDAVEALTWVQNDNTVGDNRKHLLHPILMQLARQNPELAMDTALAEPLQDGVYGYEAQVINSLAWKDVELALNLFPRVRDGETKRMARDAIGIALIYKGEVERAFELGSNLQGEDRKRYDNLLTNEWARRSPTELFENLHDLGSTELQSFAAFTLIQLNTWQRNLTDQQVNAASKYLSKQHWEELKRHGMEFD
ncbi:MAG: hypothetical protein OXO49_07320 [Gammaproteobacteria bacterium]|nr:hypothetical protein [Gammaproteobacteria bacterium]MDE0252459.1 hypothetical protein [Gammaproteobacteria bacterium]MDE0402432.1 hypothetical protein [Gammaproteobacteria bacterium]